MKMMPVSNLQGITAIQLKTWTEGRIITKQGQPVAVLLPYEQFLMMQNLLGEGEPIPVPPQFGVRK